MTREDIIAIYDRGLQAVLALVENLLEKLLALERENQTLKEKVASLEKDSTNSNKPPSSDGLKKKRGSPKRGASGRKPGGQKGHVGKARAPVLPEQVSETVPHKPSACKECGEVFAEDTPGVAVERRHTFEIPQIKPTVTEHVFYEFTCGNGHQTRELVPDWIMSGAGERLQALLAYLTGETKLSRRLVQKLLEEVFGMPLALGTVQNRLEDTSEVLKPTCDELEESLPEQSEVNVDETSYPHNRKLHWLWGFVTKTFAFFAIRASRGSKVLKELLGERYDGIIMCDRFSAYIKYHKDRACGLIQFCWAHIIRSAKALPCVLACGTNELFSRLVRQRIGAVFRLWYALKNNQISRAELIEKAQVPIAGLRTLLEDNAQSSSKEVRTFCTGQMDKWPSLFTFVYYEGIEPTNNLAERALRLGVETRKISYGTRSEAGQLLRARLLTVIQTCRMQGRNSFEFLVAAIHAKRYGLPFPSLLRPVGQNAQRMSA